MAFNDANEVLVLTKIQTAEGTPATPSESTDAIWNSNSNVIQPNTNFTDDAFLSTDPTPQPQSQGRRKSDVHIETKLMARGDNTSSGQPSLDDLLRMCGMVGSTGTEATSKDYTSYTPVTDTSLYEFGTIWSYEGGVLYKASDCQGTFVLTMQPSATPNLVFDLSGDFIAPTSVATPTPTYPTDTKVMVENEGLVIGAYSPTWTNFSITHGNNIGELLDGNSDKGFYGGRIEDRRGARINLTVRAENTLANYDFFDYVESQGAGGAYDDISLTHGDGVQSDIVITCTDPQILGDPRKSVANGIRQYELTYLLRTYTIKFREEQP